MASFNFDKFIEDICNREKSNQENLKKMTEEKEEPAAAWNIAAFKPIFHNMIQ